MNFSTIFEIVGDLFADLFSGIFHGTIFVAFFRNFHNLLQYFNFSPISIIFMACLAFSAVNTSKKASYFGGAAKVASTQKCGIARHVHGNA